MLYVNGLALCGRAYVLLRFTAPLPYARILQVWCSAVKFLCAAAKPALLKQVAASRSMSLATIHARGSRKIRNKLVLAAAVHN